MLNGKANKKMDIRLPEVVISIALININISMTTVLKLKTKTNYFKK